MTRLWSKLKSRIEALFTPKLPLAIHCNVFVKWDKGFDFDKPLDNDWGHGRATC
jgi:hypothetical protein